jgi:hypothetical protein
METTLDEPFGPTNDNNSAKEGKVLGILGFVISVIALVLWILVSGIALMDAIAGGGMDLAICWVIFSLSGIAFSVSGLIKAKAVNGKKGLAIAGLIIGIFATFLSVRTIFVVKTVQETWGDSRKLLEKLDKNINKDKHADTGSAH